MHDPMTVAWEIRSPIKRKSEFFPEGYRNSLVTIWHVDPERDGSDDSCGWFMRARHGDPKVLQSIENEFAFAWDSEHSGWFNADGTPRYAPMAIALGLFRLAAWVHFRKDHRRVDRFMKRNLYHILSFAENPVDSLHWAITGRHGFDQKDRRIQHFASIVYSWILRETRPWWRHPRFHVHHFKLQVHALQTFKRWAFSRCAGCGKRFPWGYSPVSHSWHGTGPRWFRGEEGVYHQECSGGGVAASLAPAEGVAPDA